MLACAITALLYKGALDTPFVFDDADTILLNPSLAGALDVRAVLTHSIARPVANISYAVDRWVWGMSSFGFHVTSGILHLIVVAMLYGWCTRALSDELARARHAGTIGPEWPAFFAAAIFAVHPVIGASVVYLSARPEILCALGMLASLTFARRAIATANRTAAVLAVAAGIFAVASSVSAAALPLLVLAYDAWILRDHGWTRRMWRVYLPATVLIALAATTQAFAALSAEHVSPVGPIGNLLTEALVIWRYVALLLWPHELALVHQVRWIAGPWDPVAMLAVGLLVSCGVAAFAIRRSRPLIAFGMLWFLAALAPTSTIFPVHDAMTERRLYVATMGLLLAGASASAVPLAWSRAARAIATIVLVVLMAQTYRRHRLWADPLRLWQEAVERSPNAWQAHLGYADMLREIHRCDNATREYDQVLRLYPQQPGAIAGLKACR